MYPLSSRQALTAQISNTSRSSPSGSTLIVTMTAADLLLTFRTSLYRAAGICSKSFDSDSSTIVKNVWDLASTALNLQWDMKFGRKSQKVSRMIINIFIRLVSRGSILWVDNDFAIVEKPSYLLSSKAIGVLEVFSAVAILSKLSSRRFKIAGCTATVESSTAYWCGQFPIIWRLNNSVL